MMPSSQPPRRREQVRRYSLNWLHQAACRVYERELLAHEEHMSIQIRRGLTGRFDLTDLSHWVHGKSRH
jgi:hypothetical protein